MEIILNMLPVLLLHGLVYGMLIFLVASGLTLIYGMLEVLNFAHASVYMIGGYICYQIIVWTQNFWIALLIAPIFCGALGILIERVFIRKVHKSGHVNELLLTFGLAMVIAEIIEWIYGSAPLPVPGPDSLQASWVLWSKTEYPIYRFFILALSAFVLASISYLFKKTRLGISVRACVQDGEMAGALGTNVAFLYMAVMGIGSWLAGIAGVVVAPYMSIYPNMYADMILDCFVVIALGGLGSLTGALVSSLIVGQIQAFGVILLPQFSLVLIYMLMVVVFVVKPTGMFGAKE